MDRHFSVLALLLASGFGFQCSVAPEPVNRPTFYKAVKTSVKQTGSENAEADAKQSSEQTSDLSPDAAPDKSPTTDPVEAPIPTVPPTSDSTPELSSKILSISVKSSSGGEPIKGQGIKVGITVENTSEKTESLVLNPSLTWLKSTVKDFALPSQAIVIEAKEKKSIVISVDSFITGVNKKNVAALTHGKWELNLKIEDPITKKTSTANHAFNVAFSRTVFMLVFHQNDAAQKLNVPDLEGAIRNEFTKPRKVLNFRFNAIRTLDQGYLKEMAVDLKIKTIPGCVKGATEPVACIFELTDIPISAKSKERLSPELRGYDFVSLFIDGNGRSNAGPFYSIPLTQTLNSSNIISTLAGALVFDPDSGPSMTDNSDPSTLAFSESDLEKHKAGWKAFDELMAKRSE